MKMYYIIQIYNTLLAWSVKKIKIKIIIFKFIILNDKYYNNVFRNIYLHKLQIIK
jgi:hypothetical protein